MSTEKTIEQLIERFIRDITQIVRRVQHETRLATLRTMGPRPPEPRQESRVVGERRKKLVSAPAQGRAESTPTKRARPPARRSFGPVSTGRKATSPAKAPRKIEHGAGRTTRTEAAVKGRVFGGLSARRRIQTIERSALMPTTDPWSGLVTPPSPAAAASEPASDRPALTGPERDAAVLDAVRFLVRATAGEISDRANLPNSTVYVILRALVTAGRVAKSESARGVEYSLVSTGGIHPFKRQSVPPAVGEGSRSEGDEANGASDTTASAASFEHSEPPLPPAPSGETPEKAIAAE